MCQKPPWGHFPSDSLVLSIDNTSIGTSENTLRWSLGEHWFLNTISFPRLSGHCLWGYCHFWHSLAFSPSCVAVLPRWAVLPGTVLWAGPHRGLVRLIPTWALAPACVCPLSLSICSGSCGHLLCQQWVSADVTPGYHHLCWTLPAGPVPHDFSGLCRVFLVETFGSVLVACSFLRNPSVLRVSLEIYFQLIFEKIKITVEKVEHLNWVS